MLCDHVSKRNKVAMYMRSRSRRYNSQGRLRGEQGPRVIVNVIDGIRVMLETKEIEGKHR